MRLRASKTARTCPRCHYFTEEHKTVGDCIAFVQQHYLDLLADAQMDYHNRIKELNEELYDKTQALKEGKPVKDTSNGIRMAL